MGGGFRPTFIKPKWIICPNSKRAKCINECWKPPCVSVQVEITGEAESFGAFLLVGTTLWKSADSLSKFLDSCSQSKRHFTKWTEKKLVLSVSVVLDADGLLKLMFEELWIVSCSSVLSWMNSSARLRVYKITWCLCSPQFDRTDQSISVFITVFIL